MFPLRNIAGKLAVRNRKIFNEIKGIQIRCRLLQAADIAAAG